ncbi:MAG: LolA family protein [Caulobacteraceae bacterium]
MPSLKFNRRRMLIAAAAVSAFGAAPARSSLSPGDEALVTRAVAYLESLSNAKGRFLQVDPRGTVSRGEFYLRRPGKARFQYDPPSGMVVASDGRLVSVLDPRLNSFRNYPLRMTPLALLLGRDIRLGRGAAITAVTPAPGGFAITARDGHSRTGGVLTLDFSETPIALTGWTVVDAQGGATRVRLLDFAPTGPLSPSLFDLRRPRVVPPRDRSPAFGLPN